jgi:hypothetical protein
VQEERPPTGWRKPERRARRGDGTLNLVSGVLLFPCWVTTDFGLIWLSCGVCSTLSWSSPTTLRTFSNLVLVPKRLCGLAVIARLISKVQGYG